ncbi:hypothetical protein Sme01_34860 [Sphaerisporangium melleum]|uniref:Uncharacterized protein n=1 Tax=Sphaerisporangium melleum TaxID=321316 RepID=A0A917VLM3_9ACTN|nr:hypothetical protein GCM10007964_43510 [Sphaerisporangium melleum]GII71010.1 hypothetical protein Sme01_34860 [Sphaerisporangium melleum]
MPRADITRIGRVDLKPKRHATNRKIHRQGPWRADSPEQIMGTPYVGGPGPRAPAGPALAERTRRAPGRLGGAADASERKGGGVERLTTGTSTVGRSARA